MDWSTLWSRWTQGGPNQHNQPCRPCFWHWPWHDPILMISTQLGEIDFNLQHHGYWIRKTFSNEAHNHAKVIWIFILYRIRIWSGAISLLISNWFLKVYIHFKEVLLSDKYLQKSMKGAVALLSTQLQIHRAWSIGLYR